MNQFHTFCRIVRRLDRIPVIDQKIIVEHGLIVDDIAFAIVLNPGLDSAHYHDGDEAPAQHIADSQRLRMQGCLGQRIDDQQEYKQPEHEVILVIIIRRHLTILIRDCKHDQRHDEKHRAKPAKKVVLLLLHHKNHSQYCHRQKEEEITVEVSVDCAFGGKCRANRNIHTVIGNEDIHIGIDDSVDYRNEKDSKPGEESLWTEEILLTELLIEQGKPNRKIGHRHEENITLEDSITADHKEEDI